MGEGIYHSDDLKRVSDETLVEHIHGPDDGAFLPICRNGLRGNGIYVPVNSAGGNCVAMQFVHSEPWE
jgi:hypothetical protein